MFSGDIPMKMALGTVQFGQNYGVANRSGQIDPSEIAVILDFARRSGIDTLDTAIAYGDSEARLGAAHVGDFRIVTKLPPLPSDSPDVMDWALSQMELSRKKLQVKSLYAVLCHNAPDWFGEHADALHAALARAKATGIVRKIGVSIYEPSMLERVCARAMPELVQAPMNLLDRRLADSGWLDRLHAEGIEIHARSLFLQGLLLMDRDAIPAKFSPWRDVWEQWRAMLVAAGTSPIEACLWHILSDPRIDRAVVGVDSFKHLHQLVDIARHVPESFDFPSLDIWDARLLTPSNWSSL